MKHRLGSKALYRPFAVHNRLFIITKSGKIIAFNPVKVKKPVDQNPRSTTSPRPKDGKIPSITANKYIKRIPITNVGSETPNKEIAKIVSLRKPLRLIPCL